MKHFIYLFLFCFFLSHSLWSPSITELIFLYISLNFSLSLFFILSTDLEQYTGTGHLSTELFYLPHL